MVRGVLTNPLIVGTLAEALCCGGWGYASAPAGCLLRALGSVATPLALFLLGASLDFDKARQRAAADVERGGRG